MPEQGILVGIVIVAIVLSVVVIVAAVRTAGMTRFRKEHNLPNADQDLRAVVENWDLLSPEERGDIVRIVKRSKLRYRNRRKRS